MIELILIPPQGFTPDLLKKLHESSRYTGDYQMKYLLETMLERKEVTAADVLSRVNFIINGERLGRVCTGGREVDLKLYSSFLEMKPHSC